MTTEPRPRNVRINLQAVRANADAAIMEVIHMVSFGLSGTSADPGGPSGLPGAQMQFVWDGAPDPAQTKEMFDRWIVGLGIRRYIEAANQFLDQAGVMASIVHRSKHAEYSFDLGAEPARINGMSLPQKVDHIQERLEHPLETRAIDELLSVNKARNCYAHRGGIVGALDINDAANGTVTVGWSTLMVSVGHQDGSTELLESPVGSVIEGGASIGIGWEPREKAFHLGDPLSFTPGEFGEIGLSMIRANMLTADAIAKAMAPER